MTTTCPACHKAVDSLRSRFVGVRGGKVVAYCSAECAAGRPAVSVGGAISPATGIPTRIGTPPRGVPPPPPRAAESLAGPPRPITPPPGVPISLDSGPVITIESGSGAVVTEPPRSSEPSESSDATVRTEPRAKHPDEIPISAFWIADKEKSSTSRVPRAPSSQPIGVAVIRDDDLDARPLRAESGGHLDDETLPVRTRRLPVVLVVLLVLGAGGMVLYRYLIKHNVSASTEVQRAPSPAVIEAVRPAPPPAPPPEVDPAAAVEQARGALRAALTATSPRVSRLAAEALARTEDPAARDRLAAQLGLPASQPGAAPAGTAEAPETSDIGKLELAYSLARGHDKRGAAALAAALGSPRAEVRDEAARLLALLGDPRAVPHLIDLLAVSQRRLGAAEHLAHLAEPHGLKALEQVRADAKASADDKARATIALGIAGHPDVAPALRDMLGDAHFNAFAAAALAELKDAAARPVLERQLDSPALRVRAARALRRLDPALDARSVLPRLLEVLSTGRDTDQVQAAEAILLLAGPPAWSAYD